MMRSQFASTGVSRRAVGWGVISVLALVITTVVMVSFRSRSVYAVPAILIMVPNLFLCMGVYARVPFAQAVPFHVFVAGVWGCLAGGIGLLFSRIYSRLRGRFSRAYAIGLIIILAGYIMLEVSAAGRMIDTRNAAGYSEAAFNSIQIGDSQDQVLQLLGEPLHMYETCQGCKGGFWAYTDSPTNGGFLIRVIDFDDNGNVDSIDRQVYFPMG